MGQLYRFARSQEALRQATRLRAGNLPWPARLFGSNGEFPAYIVRAKGCRCWDIDGNEFLDLTMAYGPIVLGYADPVVDEAVRQQIDRGVLFTLDNTLQDQLAEMLRVRIPSAEMATFFKTGSEATTAALRIARRYTGRRRIACCGYHGWHDWCLPTADYVPDHLADQVLPFIASDPATLVQTLEAYPGEVAAVIVAPEAVVPPEAETFQALVRIAHYHGAVFILDEIKTGLRIRPGTMQQHLGICPDMTTLSKALANGYPLAAVVGRREVMTAGDGVHTSGTFNGDAIAMAAAIATLTELEIRDSRNHVWSLGERLISGLQRLLEHHGLPADAVAAPLPPMPVLVFRHPIPGVNAHLQRVFFKHVIRRGVLLYPRHMWFMAASHSTDDVDHVLEVAAEAMAITKRVQEEAEMDSAAGTASRATPQPGAPGAERRYRAALIGCGERAKMHAAAYASLSRARLVACCDIDEGRARTFSESFGNLARYRDPQAMLEREQPDVLHIVTPPRVRYELLVLAAEHRVPAVIVEKPLAVDASDYRRIRALAGSTQTRFIANHQLRFQPVLRALIRNVLEDGIGQIRHIEASARLSLADQGAHLLDLALAFNGDSPIVSVFASTAGASMLGSDHPGPDSALADFSFLNGARAVVACGANAPRASADAREYRQKRIAVYGSRGFVHWQMQRWEQFTERGGYEGGQIEYASEDIQAQAAMVDAVIDALEDGGRSHPTGFDTSLGVVSGILGCYASALSGATVSLPYAGEEDLLPKLLGSTLLGPLFA